MPTKTHSEYLFEEYLRNQAIDFVYEEELPGRRKRPDYKVEKQGKRHWFEVKELLDPETMPTGGFDPTPPYEEKIDRAREQFREFKEDCCVLVLHGCRSIFRRPMVHEIVSAAFGEFLVVEPAAGQTAFDEPLRFKCSGKAKLRPDANTTISAVIILQHFQLDTRWVEAFYRIRERMSRAEEVGPFAYAEEVGSMKNCEGDVEFENTVRAVILENPHARIHLPNDLLHGPLDQRWGNKDSSDWYTLISIGSELERLRSRPRPVPYLFI